MLNVPDENLERFDTPMNELHAGYRVGRRFLARLPHGEDLNTAVEDLCRRRDIKQAVFQVTGAVSLLTIGIFDQTQQVYVTDRQKRDFEIVSCGGNVSRQQERYVLNSRIAAADTEGRLTGGALFSPTCIYAAEIDLQELIGDPLKRTYDPSTGLMLWSNG
jgi:predicted DNA-binding protein with PD1-like motif